MSARINDDASGVKSIPRLFGVSSQALGKVLDHGKIGACAAHLLAIKAAHKPDFTLNEHHVKKCHGIGRDRFYAALRLLRSAGVLTRSQPNKRSCAEERIEVDIGCKALFPAEILTESSSTVAFYLAVTLGKKPSRPAEIAKRIGVTSRTTIAKLTKAAVSYGCACNDPGNGKAILLARRGFSFDLSKKTQSKKTQSKNQHTQEGKERSSAKYESPFSWKENLGALGHSAFQARNDPNGEDDFAKRGGDPSLSYEYGDSDLNEFFHEWRPVNRNQCPDSLIVHVLRWGTGGRIGSNLIGPDGIETAREILGALAGKHAQIHTGISDDDDIIDSYGHGDIEAALDAMYALLRNATGDRRGRWLNSYDLIAKRLYGLAKGGDWDFDSLGKPKLELDWDHFWRLESKRTA